MKSQRMKLFKAVVLLAALLSTTLLYAEKYNAWIDNQIQLIKQTNDHNLTQKELTKIFDERDKLYMQALRSILLKKAGLLQYIKHYDNEIYRLEKMIKVNRRYGNKEAVLRDEVQVKSYKLLEIQNRMVQRIFKALDSMSVSAFEKEMYKIFSESQLEINKLDNQNKRYRDILNKKPKSRLEKKVQENIKEFYALMEINVDILRYFSENARHVYRLNQYTQYYILKPALYVDGFADKWHINDVLKPYGLSAVKVVLILLVTVLIFLIRTVLIGLIERLILKFKYVGHYAKEIIADIKSPISLLLVLINIELILFIYNDFSTYVSLGKFFNILHTFFVTFIAYRMLNSIARVRLEHLDQSNKHIKSELFNLTVKILNFLVVLVGMLFALHFAGVNLTAVLSGLGIGGFAVALAARESLSNFFGTISILMSEIFSQGDWIEVDGKEGNVVEIGLRVTTIRTFDNALIAIPNATLANKEVKNWSRRIVGRRIKMKISVTYDSPREALQNTVAQIRQMLHDHPDIATERTMYEDRSKKSAKLVSKEDELGVKRTLMVYLDEFADSSIDILVYTFTKSTVWSEWLKVKEDVMYQIMEIVEVNGLKFAFPTITLDQPEEGTKG